MLAIPSTSNVPNPVENAQAQGDTGIAVTLIPPSPRGQSHIMQINFQGARPRSQFHPRPLDFRSPFVINSPPSTSRQPWQYNNSDQTVQANQGLPRQPVTDWRSPYSANANQSLFRQPGLERSPGQDGRVAPPRQTGQNVLIGLNRQAGLNRQDEQDGQQSAAQALLRDFGRQTAQDERPSTSRQPQGSPGQQTDPSRQPAATTTIDHFDREFLAGFGTNCSNCQQDKAFSKCFECNEYLCNVCSIAHERVRVTKNHTIYNFNTIANRLSPTLTGGLTQPNTQPINNQFQPITDQSQPGPSNYNPLSSRVVGAGRRSSNTSPSTGGSPGNSIENLLAAASRRTSLELTPPHQQLHNLTLTDSEIMTLGRLLSNASQPPITSPSGSLPPIASPPSNRTSEAGASLVNEDTISTNGQGDVTGEATDDSMALALPETILPPCPRHQMPFGFFCSTCIVPVCNACLQQGHSDHSMLHISEGLARARQMSEELNSDIRQMNLNLRQALDSLQRMCEGIDIKANQVAIDVKSIVKKFIAAFEAREVDVLRRIEQARQVKIRLITFQMENIRLHYSKLARASDLINDPNKFPTDFEVMIANHNAFRELRQARNLGPNIYPCEDDNFLFVPPQESFLQNVTQFGHLHISSSPLTNAIRLYRQPLLYISQQHLADPPFPAAKSRPIYGCNELITIKDFGKTPKRIWGKPGPAPGFFCRPWGIAMNRFGEIIISDRSNNRIQIFDSEGKYLFHFGSHGKGFGQFDRPASVAINSNDDIVVSDKDNHRVQVFNRHGEFLLTFGERGSSIGQFLYPWDIAIDSLGNILVSDTRNHRIQLFKWNGIFIAKWGGETYGNIRLFDSPRGVTFDPHGNILVTDFNLHKVIMIERGSGKVRVIGREGSERGQFNRPQGICCDDRGWFIVADSRNYRYQVFNERGEFMWMVGKHGKEDPGEFDRPSDMFIDPEGHIHLMDFGNDRIQVF